MAESTEKETYDEAMSALHCCSLSQPLDLLRLRYYFLCSVFDLKSSEYVWAMQATNNVFESFFTRYALLCKLAANKDREVENVTHRHLVDIIALLKDTKAYNSPSQGTREAIIRTVMRDPVVAHSKNLAGTLVDLAAGLWLMLSISKYPGDISYDEPIIWEDEEALVPLGLVDKTFFNQYNSTDLVKLPQSFTAAHLEQIAGIKVIWTSNLADHLLLKDDDTKLMLFHQISILQLHKMSSTTLLPKDLVDETIRSISLLIPPVFGEPNPWFQQQRKKSQEKGQIDAQAGICERLNSSERQIGKFKYWRDRLVLLKRTFDDAEPRNISQLWWDDRKKTQWFTFWVAVLVFVMTVFFGIVQSVAGIVQAWASVRSLKTSQG